MHKFGFATNINITGSDHTVPILWTDLYIFGSWAIARDTFEDIALKIFFRKGLDIDGNTFVYYNVINEDLFRLYGSDINLMWTTKLYLYDFNRPFRPKTHHAIILSSILTCTFVTFEPSNFTVDWNRTDVIGNVVIHLDVGGTNITISDTSDMNSLVVTENYELNVCTEVLEKYLKLAQGHKTIKPIALAIYILTYICPLTSALCLLLTLVAYLALPDLRTVPGFNAMLLSLSLLLAQMALICASLIPTPSTLCTSVGLITHFLWLWHFSWSFLCSLHVFQMFTDKIPEATMKGGKKLIYAARVTTLSLIGPLVVVLAVIVSSYMTSHIGYGHMSCFLDLLFLLGLSVVAPICFVSISNLTFLGITVARIRESNQLTSLAPVEVDQHKYFLLYVKLSSVTGVFWVMTFVAEAIDSDVLCIPNFDYLPQNSISNFDYLPQNSIPNFDYLPQNSISNSDQLPQSPNSISNYLPQSPVFNSDYLP
ncbi:adhesion G protein-coupled receptor E2 [Biomphalaria glabrata]|nr:adhesion G protein-coupled receptor E2-like [Biomphalaria glabrata]